MRLEHHSHWFAVRCCTV